MKTTLRILISIAVCAALTIGFARCEPDDPTEPRPRSDGALLEVAGVSITRDQLEDFDAYFDELDPHLGRKVIIRELLTQHLLPTAFAQRDFAGVRAEQLQRAQALSSVVGNYLELREIGPAHGGYEPEKPYSRTSLPFPVARFAFDELNLGRASPPIETQQGYVIVAPRDIVQGAATTQDLCHAFIVFFHTHTNDEYLEWWRAAKAAARNSVTYVHPDLVGALPVWLEP